MKNKKITPNFLLITLDSCRWDTYKMANTPVLDHFFSFKKAYSQATYTLPSHISMYQGMFPSLIQNIPYYNRFSKPILRINERNSSVKALINFPKGTNNIFEGFANYGKNTFGLGAMGWFKHPILTSCFEKFEFTGIHVLKQCQLAKKFITKNKNYAILINIGETHEPYKYGGMIKPSLKSRARVRAFEIGEYDKNLHNMQIKALEYIDNELKDLLYFISKDNTPLLMVCCGDHGECFGENSLWGHGFYHPKVMEVPLGIGSINYTIN
jgi:membrane-anchored protein YejM (alkaline phosphatase superfamily)